MPDWQRQIAIRQWQQIGIIEPPIMEFLAAQTYRLSGVQLWVPRLYSIIFWVLAGIPLYLLVLQLTHVPVAGLVALALYVSLPYGGIASRSFQPDPLMVACTVTAWWAMFSWYRKPTWSHAMLAGGFSGLAILVKNLSVFLIFPPLLLLIWERFRWRAWREPQTWALLILTVLPAGVYTLYGVWINGFLKGQFGGRFFPHLWINPVFYIRWLGQIEHVAGSRYLFALGLVGIGLAHDPTQRRFLLTLWLGYFMLGFGFSYHFMTHDYYHLPLIPLVAISVAPVIDLFQRHLFESRVSRPMTVVLVGVLLVLFANNLWDIRVTLKRDDYRHEAAYWAALGEKLRKSNVMALTHDYGYRLAYWGWKDAGNWPTQGDLYLRELMGGSAEEALQEFQNRIQGYDYFLITLMGEYENQPALKQVLEQNYPLLEKGDGYLIFDLRHPKTSP
jgi:4-amino-4-deoxy-L-arabinose transferase-like glycosyltransferase